jgi:glycosyltransferase involved in cell wall biosynthesis
LGDANGKSEVKNNMRAAIYNPYLDTLGGGERYSVSFGKVLSDAGYKVDIWWKQNSIKKKLEKRFGLDLTEIDVVGDIKRGEGYDLLFWVSDGSVPLLRARRNFLHFQYPFKDVNGRSLINKMKFFRIDKIICNSFFTKDFIDKEYGVNSLVIYPPVDTHKFKPKRKENIILFVGRFSQLTQAKNQHVLVDAFKRLTKSETNPWKLILAGGMEVGADVYLKTLEKSAMHRNVDIVTSPSFSELTDLCGRSKIFWSAVGYETNINKEPQKAEHFGISVIEAMSAGAVPLVFDAGGHKEIISDGLNGFFWKTESNLIKSTKKLIDDEGLLKHLSKQAKEDSQIYEYERFEAEVSELLGR